MGLTWLIKVLGSLENQVSILVWNDSTQMGKKVKGWIWWPGGSGQPNARYTTRYITPWILTHTGKQGNKMHTKTPCASDKSYMLCEC